MRHLFYDSPEYQRIQSEIAKRKRAEGLYDHLTKWDKRTCLHQECRKVFWVKPGDPKHYCSQSCAATCTNRIRGPRSEETRRKIAASIKTLFPEGPPIPFRKVAAPPLQKVCENSQCGKIFSYPGHQKKRKYCSGPCRDYDNIRLIGQRPTSPRASRGKAGVRLDISPTIYFYSRWEANIARLYNHLGTEWVYAPSSFDLGGQIYTPDFYLPGSDKYIEVKNFWWKYSKERDEKFRRLYPHTKLEVILKPEYLVFEEKYAPTIPNWEYRNSSVPQLD